MRHSLFSAMCALAIGFAGPAFAGNIVLTGHDNDLHENFGSSNSVAALTAELSFVRGGSALPVLVIDAGNEATNSVGALIGAGNVVGIAPGSVTAASFNHSLYSAFVVASVSTCGGCDNPVGTGTTLATYSTAIAAFFNAGGGILGLSGASDPNAYAYVPQAASNAGGSPGSSGFTQTADGLALGIPAVNGDPTHNFFGEPGSIGGPASAYVVVERFGSATTGTPETIALAGGTITEGGTITTNAPEPITLSLLGVGLFGIAAARRRAGR